MKLTPIMLHSTPLFSELEVEIQRLILSGELAAGERLNEFRLAKLFGISRGPLREAIRGLQAKGFLEAIHNKGVFVCQLDLPDVLDIYDLRAALFSLAVRLSCAKISDSGIKELGNLVARMAEAAKSKDIETYYPLNIAFHDTILRSSENASLMMEYRKFVDRMHLFRRIGLVQADSLNVSNREHTLILEALRARDPEAAAKVAWDHVELAKFRLMAAVEKQDGACGEP